MFFFTYQEKVVEGKVLARYGENYTVLYDDDQSIRLSKARLYQTYEEANSHLE
ncbi:hypothetical protein [Ohessyouella blattaphilus]|uniref:Uncharacterized protein n=1 Tax=Ohessyouella blattaphilus TaxID=2949333 RepID=A0ABT1EK96_9FIRM|nr:hypothetical protein [Ohessyouella blattaphilus]MCP1110914.1 hypothetical protein [Ohessyouella blattaphilus]MCR8564308.1 hypothetical protein [Ohessyouella blattaphilus]